MKNKQWRATMCKVDDVPFEGMQLYLSHRLSLFATFTGSVSTRFERSGF